MASTPVEAEFYTVQLAPLIDGRIFVSLTATVVDDEEPQLLSQEITTDRVATIDDALAIIKTGIMKSDNIP
jgi:hypothetical protein